VGGGGCLVSFSILFMHLHAHVLTSFSVIDGIITLPVALYGFLLFPGKSCLNEMHVRHILTSYLYLCRHPPQHKGPLPLRHRKGARHIPRPRSQRTNPHFLLLLETLLQHMVLVFLRHPLDPRRRNRILQHKRLVAVIHAVSSNGNIYRSPEQQLSNRSTGRRHSIHTLLGNPHGFHGRKTLSSGLLDRSHRHHNLRAHPRLSTLHTHPLRHVLLGGQRIRLPSHVLRVGERCAKVRRR